MNFIWLNKQGVESDTGVRLQFTGRFTAVYEDRNYLIHLDIEDGWLGDRPVVILRRRRWTDRKTGLPIPTAALDEIHSNLQAAIEFQGLKLVLE
jgi:hypothetical protein